MRSKYLLLQKNTVRTRAKCTFAHSKYDISSSELWQRSNPIHVSMTSEQGGRNLDIFLTGMHLAVITGDRFCTDFAHLKQACWHDTYCMSYIIRRTEVIKRRLYRFKYGFLTKMHRFATGGIYSPPGAMWCIYIYMYAVSRRFYPKRLTVHSGYTFVLSVCVFPAWESNPQPLRC